MAAYTHKAMTMASEAERIQAPLEYPEHDDLNHEESLISEAYDEVSNPIRHEFLALITASATQHNGLSP